MNKVKIKLDTYSGLNILVAGVSLAGLVKSINDARKNGVMFSIETGGKRDYYNPDKVVFVKEVDEWSDN